MKLGKQSLSLDQNDHRSPHLSAARAEGRNKDDRTCVPLLAVLGAATRRTNRLLAHLVLQPPGWICLIVPACINASQGISHGIVLSEHMVPDRSRTGAPRVIAMLARQCVP